MWSCFHPCFHFLKEMTIIPFFLLIHNFSLNRHQNQGKERIYQPDGIYQHVISQPKDSDPDWDPWTWACAVLDWVSLSWCVPGGSAGEHLLVNHHPYRTQSSPTHVHLPGSFGSHWPRSLCSHCSKDAGHLLVWLLFHVPWCLPYSALLHPCLCRAWNLASCWPWPLTAMLPSMILWGTHPSSHLSLYFGWYWWW